MDELQDFINVTVELWREKSRAYALAAWEAAIAGTPENNEREQAAQADYMRFWADPVRYALARRLHESASAAGPLAARQIKLIYLEAAKNQQNEADIEKQTRLEADIRDRYYNFRAEVGHERISDNELDTLLHKSSDAALARQAWEASKQVGLEVADRVRELARARNESARRQAYRDYFQQQLVLNEIDEDQLLAIFARLQAATDEPFAGVKAEVDRARAARFGVPKSELYPWHYGDRFFQSAPDLGQVDVDALFAGHDPVALALTTFDGLGLEVRDILERSDLYARAGKNQHAFCTDIDREGDVRTLNNLERNERWAKTLLHELGHAVYDKYQDRSLPWDLRGPAHTLSTEAIAQLMGALTSDGEWLNQVVGVPSGQAEAVAVAGLARERASRLIFTRWVLVMTHFERALYADPDSDLNTTWWQLVERYQGLRRPPDRQAPDWAAKIHIALYPVYYHNYELGLLITAQVEDRLRRHAGGIVGRLAAGSWLKDKFFLPGKREDWTRHIATATDERLNPQYFVNSVR